MRKNKLLVILVILFLAGGIFWYLKNHQPVSNKPPVLSPGSVHSIVLSKEGFSPEEITIQQGERVVFTSTAGRDFWPASDLHPTHGIYAEFDPKQPVGVDKTWEFVFDRVGKWKYHDHLFSSRRGVINVVANGEASASPVDCDLAQGSGCWQEQLDSVLETRGLEKAFELLANLYASKPAFAAECHGYAHNLGDSAYALFSQNKDFEIGVKTSYCGYGFYHGFMEKLLQTSGNVQEAKDFCKFIGNKLAAFSSDAEGACYHGIGHGAVDGGDPTAWGNASKMMSPAMALCQKVASEDASRFGKLYRCVSGAFNAIEILSSDTKYNLGEIKKNPFYLCPAQQPRFYEACYTNMLPAVLRLTSNDFKKSANMVESIQSADSFVKPQVMLSLFHDWIRLNFKEPEFAVSQGLKICRGLISDMRLPCVEGLSGGHMKYGEPQKEYIKGLEFCASKILLDDERQTCYSFILPRLRVWYSKEKTAEICGLIPEKYKSFCHL